MEDDKPDWLDDLLADQARREKKRAQLLDACIRAEKMSRHADEFNAQQAQTKEQK